MGRAGDGVCGVGRRRVAAGAGVGRGGELRTHAAWGGEILNGGAIPRATVVMAGTVINADEAGLGAIVGKQPGAVADKYTTRRLETLRRGRSVEVGGFSHLGMGAVVLERICVGSHVIVGAGAVVVEDLPDEVVPMGVPARILQTFLREVESVSIAASRDRNHDTEGGIECVGYRRRTAEPQGAVRALAFF